MDHVLVNAALVVSAALCLRVRRRSLGALVRLLYFVVDFALRLLAARHTRWRCELDAARFNEFLQLALAVVELDARVVIVALGNYYVLRHLLLLLLQHRDVVVEVVDLRVVVAGVVVQLAVQLLVGRVHRLDGVLHLHPRCDELDDLRAGFNVS